MKVEAKIVIEGNHATVELKGVWTRRLIDAAYSVMLREVPKHTVLLKERIIIPDSIIEPEERKEV